MSAIRVRIEPVDSGSSLSTTIVAGGTSDEVVQVTAAGSVAVTNLLSKFRNGTSTVGSAAYLALTDAAVLAMVDAAVAITNMSTTQKTALIDYITFISAQTDTSSIETAIDAI